MVTHGSWRAVTSQRKYIPVVLSHEEIDLILQHLPYPNASKAFGVNAQTFL